MDNKEQKHSTVSRFVPQYVGTLSDSVLAEGFAVVSPTPVSSAPKSVEECVGELKSALEVFLAQETHKLPFINDYCMLKGAVTGNEAVGFLVSRSPAYSWRGSETTTSVPDALPPSKELCGLIKYSLGKTVVPKG